MRGRTYSGIVIKHQPYREADEILTVWSWEIGKVRLLARGVRRGTSRLRHALVPLAWLEFDVVADSRFPIVTGAKIIASYEHARSDLLRAALVFHMFEMILRATPDREPIMAISLLLRSALQSLSSRDSVKEEFLLIFQYRFLSALGYQPGIGHCSSCGDTVSDAALFWSRVWMGVVCEKCGLRIGETTQLSSKGAQYLSAVAATAEIFPDLRLSRELQPAMQNWLQHVIHTVIERSLNSASFLLDHATALQ